MMKEFEGQIKDVFKGRIPAKVTARFIFNGHGHLAGALAALLLSPAAALAGDLADEADLHFELATDRFRAHGATVTAVQQAAWPAGSMRSVLD